MRAAPGHGRPEISKKAKEVKVEEECGKVKKQCLIERAKFLPEF
jgi:hypothetical protein